MNKKNNYLYLFIVLMLSFALHPFLEGVYSFKYLSLALTILVYLTSIYAVRDDNKFYLLIMVLGLFGILTQLIPKIFVYENFDSIGVFFQIPFLILLSWALFSNLVKEKKVSSDTILGAISVYILIGITWSYLYMGVEYLFNGSFSHTIVEGSVVSSFKTKSQFFYYSFVTLTTLGYGDIIPISSLATSLSILEGITGQMYIAILVAKLVAIYAINQGKNL